MRSGLVGSCLGGRRNDCRQGEDRKKDLWSSGTGLRLSGSRCCLRMVSVCLSLSETSRSSTLGRFHAGCNRFSTTRSAVFARVAGTYYCHSKYIMHNHPPDTRQYTGTLMHSNRQRQKSWAEQVTSAARARWYRPSLPQLYTK